MLRRLGFDAYQSAAQREAVRTVLTAPPGSVVVIDLPTGSGKSVCAFLPALLWGVDEGEVPGVTPVVVPTVALALDLGEKLARVVGHPVTYSVDNEREAEATRRRVAGGQQGPLIASPEAMMGSLRGPLAEAARGGWLRFLVVDEAHMVTAWGDEFRPAFQQVAGLRRDLLRLACASESGRPFVTALMSATLTEYNLRSLETIFPPLAPAAGQGRRGAEGEGGGPRGEACGDGAAAPEFRIAHAVRLRPETAWWSARAGDEPERRAWLLEAVRHLPKPLILYTLKRADALSWRDSLSAAGFSRVGMMRGDTADGQRRELMAAWNADDLDVVVATSAFGLGVDKPDVRAVLHAALPEGLDRLYQDVGRGGRDGYPSLSLVVWRGEDWAPAAAMASPTFIGIDRGRQRWRAMFFHPGRDVLGGGRYALPVTAPPGVEAGDIDMDNEENEKWNRRTLTLMARCGLIELEGGTGDEARDEGGGRGRGKVVVQVRPGASPNEPETWEARVEGQRKALSGSYRRNIEGLEQLLLRPADRCAALVLQECYTSEWYEIPVVRACGGCAHCRAANRPAFAGRLRPRQYPRRPTPPPVAPAGGGLRQLLGGQSLACVYYAPGAARASGGPSPAVPEEWEAWAGRATELAAWLAGQGVVNFVADPALLAAWRAGSALLTPGRVVFLHEHLPADVTRAQPAAIFVPPGPDEPLWRAVWEAAGPAEGRARAARLAEPAVLVLPEGAHDPGRADRPARHLLPGAGLTLEEWEGRYLL